MTAVPQLRSRAPNHILLEDVSWSEYLRVLSIFDERRLRITYDDGSLEIMTISPEHERAVRLFSRLIDALADARDMNIASYRAMTIKRKRNKQGLEPDDCYWFADEPKVRGKKSFNWDRDPPPELVLEIDVTKSPLDRIAIYETMGVHEVWRWTGKKLEVSVLTEAGKYTLQQRSKVFPELRPADLLPFVQLEADTGERGMLKAFRAWLADK